MARGGFVKLERQEWNAIQRELRALRREVKSRTKVHAVLLRWHELLREGTAEALEWVEELSIPGDLPAGFHQLRELAEGGEVEGDEPYPTMCAGPLSERGIECRKAWGSRPVAVPVEKPWCRQCGGVRVEQPGWLCDECECAEHDAIMNDVMGPHGQG